MRERGGRGREREGDDVEVEEAARSCDNEAIRSFATKTQMKRQSFDTRPTRKGQKEKEGTNRLFLPFL